MLEMGKPRLYYAAAMLGDRSNLEDNREIARLLEDDFEIITKHVFEDMLDIEKGAKPEEIFKRDIELLDKCDYVVADVSYPSLGVGFEIAYALLKLKPVIGICRSERVEKTSALIRGISWKNFYFVTYDTPRDAVEKIKKLIG